MPAAGRQHMCVNELKPGSSPTWSFELADDVVHMGRAGSPGGCALKPRPCMTRTCTSLLLCFSLLHTPHVHLSGLLSPPRPKQTHLGDHRPTTFAAAAADAREP